MSETPPILGDIKPEEDELRKFFSEMTSNKRAYRRASAISLISIVLAGLWLAFSIYKVTTLRQETSDLLKQKQQLSGEVERLRTEKDELERNTELLPVRESAAARRESQELASATSINDRGAVTVQYFAKDIEGQKVESALKELGFRLEVRPAILETTFTNAIWFGPNVKTEDVKLVAYTLIRAGVEIRDIRPFLRSSGRELLIQVGGLKDAADKSVWTWERIQAGQFSR